MALNKNVQMTDTGTGRAAVAGSRQESAKTNAAQEAAKTNAAQETAKTNAAQQAAKAGQRITSAGVATANTQYSTATADSTAVEEAERRALADEAALKKALAERQNIKEVEAAEARAIADEAALKRALEERNAQPVSDNGDKAKNGGGISGGSYSTAAPTEEVPADEKATLEYTPPAATPVLDTTPPDIQKVGYYDTSTLANTLNASLQAAQQQANASIDYGVETGVNALNRALEDAQQSYQTERDQVAYDERTAMDNQALYNQARGDNGGVGQSQYNSIQNTAAQNRLAINNEQTRIAADTAQQIADLRAQGEFDKADKMLELTQDYLSKLMSIEQWGAQYNLSVDQINQAIDQWKAEYEQNAKQINANYAMNEAGLTGYYNGVPLYENAAKLVSTLAEYGIAPDTEALMRLGYSQREAEALASKVVPEPVNTGSGGGGTVKEYMESRIRQYQRQGYQAEDAISAAATDAKARYSGAEQTIAAIGDDWMR